MNQPTDEAQFTRKYRERPTEVFAYRVAADGRVATALGEVLVSAGDYVVLESHGGSFVLAPGSFLAAYEPAYPCKKCHAPLAQGADLCANCAAAYA